MATVILPIFAPQRDRTVTVPYPDVYPGRVVQKKAKSAIRPGSYLRSLLGLKKHKIMLNTVIVTFVIIIGDLKKLSSYL